VYFAVALWISSGGYIWFETDLWGITFIVFFADQHMFLRARWLNYLVNTMKISVKDIGLDGLNELLMV